MSKIVKGIGKAVKKVAKGVKKIVKGIGKVFKKVWDSKLGKVLLIAAAVFTAGVALGAWAGPGWMSGIAPQVAAGADVAGSTIASAGTAGGTTAAAGTVGTTAAAEAAALGLEGYSVAGGLSATKAGGAAVAGGLAPSVAQAGGTAAGELAAAGGMVPTVAQAGGTAAGEMAAAGGMAGSGPAYGVAGGLQGSAKGIVETIRGLGSATSTWVRDNQLVAAMGVNGLAQAFSADPVEQQRKYDEEDRVRRERNLRVGNIDVRMTPGAQEPLRDMSGNPVYNDQGGLSQNGIIGARRMLG